MAGGLCDTVRGNVHHFDPNDGFFRLPGRVRAACFGFGGFRGIGGSQNAALLGDGQGQGSQKQPTAQY